MATAPTQIPDIDQLQSRIASANITALLMTVAHLTGDTSVLREEWRPSAAEISLDTSNAEALEEARRYCLERLKELASSSVTWPASAPDDLVRAIGEWHLGPQADDLLPLLRATLVMEGEDRNAPDWTLAEMAPDREFTAAIIGTGFSGLLAALRMKQAGIPFVVFEKGAEVGGTWNENIYPDCRADVHSPVYSYSFFPYDWSSYFARQANMRAYFVEFAKQNDLYEHIEFGTEVLGAQWDEDDQVWTISVRRADEEIDRSFNILVSAVGQLNRPSIPRISGAELFEGAAFHSANWDSSIDLTGKKIAVIGTGASALQLVPASAPIAEHLTVFQRSAPWLAPTPELRKEIDDDERWLLRNLPFYRAYNRYSIFLPRILGQLDVATVDPDYPPTEKATSVASEIARTALTNYLEAQLEPDDELRQHVIPDYPVGAKRIIRDDGTWIRTLKRDNVSVVSDGIDRIDAHGLWTNSGDYIEADVIIYGTGFAASDFLTPMDIKGVGGKDLHEAWHGDAHAFFGMTMPDFPNLFCFYGPNTNLVLHGNLIFFMECQSRYLATSAKFLIESGKSSMNLRPEVFRKYCETVDEANALRVWAWSGTSSWYKTSQGHSSIMWPLPVIDYWEATLEPDPAHYALA